MKPKLIPFPLKDIFIIDSDFKIAAVAANPHRNIINYLVHLGSMITFSFVADLLQVVHVHPHVKFFSFPPTRD